MDCVQVGWEVFRTLKYLIGTPFLTAWSGREKKQVRISIQKAHEYLKGGNQVSQKLSPLQEMKAQPLQSLFVGEVTNASYQTCSLSLNSL